MIKIKINSKSKKKLAYCQLHIAYYSRLLLTAFCLLAFTTEINPTIRYVSPTGNNIPPYLSWEDAANSIQDAINVCEPGDTVLVDNRTYYENLVINTQISLIGLSMDSTVIDGRGLGDRTIIFDTDGSIKNFNIYGKANGTGTGIYSIMNLPTISVTNCNISETGRGISAAGLIADKIIMNNLRSGFINAGNPNSENYITNCIIILNMENSNGISLPGPSGANYHITNNIILFTGTDNFMPRGILVDKPKTVDIRNNIISGFGINIQFELNIESAIVQNNNLLYSRGSGLNSINDDVIIGNTILKNGGSGIWGSPIQSNYNLFWNNQLNYGSSANPGDSDRVANPMFVKDTLPNPQLDFDYRLQAYSPAIDAGNPDIVDVDGSRSDIGMYGGPLGQTYKYLDLTPATPVNASAVIYQQNQILLRWLRNSEADTSHYNVYRDTVTNFAIDSTKLIASITDTFYVEPIPPGVNMLVYKITAVDQQGNQSLPTPDRIVMIVGVDEYEVVPLDYELYQNYPNPFNPSTKIGYNLKERGYVKLMVYDITGSLVSVLVNKEQESGYYEVEFNVAQDSSPAIASGIYLYRIEVIGEGRIPKFSDMKKMVFIK